MKLDVGVKVIVEQRAHVSWYGVIISKSNTVDCWHVVADFNGNIYNVQDELITPVELIHEHRKLPKD